MWLNNWGDKLDEKSNKWWMSRREFLSWITALFAWAAISTLPWCWWGGGWSPETQTDSPETVNLPNLMWVTYSSITAQPWNVTDNDWVIWTPVVAIYYSDPNTNPSAVRLDAYNTSWVFSGLNASTTYYLVTLATVIDWTTKNSKQVMSSTLEATTNAAPTDAETITSAPTLVSVTSSSAIVQPWEFSDANWVQNVWVKVYYESTLVNEIPNLTITQLSDWNYQIDWLSAWSTVYVAMVWEAKNWINEQWEIKKSLPLEVTLNVWNQAPVASDWNYDAWFNPSITIDFSPLVSDDHDSDSQLTFEVVSNPVNLTITWAFPNLTFTAPQYRTWDSIVTYRVKDTSWVYSNVWTISILALSN